MSTTSYKITLLCAAAVALWSGIVALVLMFVSGNWADVVALVILAILATAATIVAGFALYRIMFPHDHPNPRYRIVSGSHLRN